MKKQNIIYIAAFALLFALASCTDSYTITYREVPDKIRIELTEEQHQQVKTNNDFAFELANKVVQQDQEQNCLISPLSATFVLAMLENGSAGQTQQQILDALHFDNEESMNDLCNKLIVGGPKIDTSTDIKIANGVFLNTNCIIEENYVKSMNDVFKAEVKNVNFSDSLSALKEINSWVNNNTNGKITKILGKVKPKSVMAALSAVYFKGIWRTEFDSKKTSKETFTHANGKPERIDMMKAKGNYLYGSFSNFDVIHLDYGNGGYSMEVLLPKDGLTVEDIIGSLKGADWQNMMGSMAPYEVDIQLPKFYNEYSIDMLPVLQVLGMGDMVDIATAKFPRISNINMVYVDQFQQKCLIDVNEKGAEVISQTVNVSDDGTDISPGGEPSVIRTAKFHANRPFIYLITENTTGSIYFIGTFK